MTTTNTWITATMTISDLALEQDLEEAARTGKPITMRFHVDGAPFEAQFRLRVLRQYQKPRRWYTFWRPGEWITEYRAELVTPP